MQDHSVLGQVALGFSPMIDRQRAVIATRLTVFPDRNDVTPDPNELMAALAEVWPAEAGHADVKLVSPRPLDPAAVSARAGAGVRPPVSLNIASESLLQALMGTQPGSQWMIEVPAFMVGDPAHAQGLRALHQSGSSLVLKGRPLSELPRELLPFFSHSIVDVAEDRRTGSPPPATTRDITSVQSGVRTLAEMEAAFQRGSIAVLGWPLDDPLVRTASRSAVPADIQVVMELINGVDRQDPVPKLEATLKKDPTLGFRLLRYLNSPAFGLSVEISSFGHALMMLGYQRLKRWLALLLASASKDANAKPVMFAAVRRGLLMEELGRSSGDAEMRGELFICGVFSLLDRLLKQPVEELIKSVPVPERVQQALQSGSGPFQPYLQMVMAIENESLYDIREGADRLFMGLTEVNRAVLAALRSARQLD